MNKSNVEKRMQILSELCRQIINSEKAYKAGVIKKSRIIFWYSPKNKSYRCHILGNLACGNNLCELMENAENTFVDIYNKAFDKSIKHINNCAIPKINRATKKNIQKNTFAQEINFDKQPKQLLKLSDAAKRYYGIK